MLWLSAFDLTYIRRIIRLGPEIGAWLQACLILLWQSVTGASLCQTGVIHPHTDVTHRRIPDLSTVRCMSQANSAALPQIDRVAGQSLQSDLFLHKDTPPRSLFFSEQRS